MYYIAFVWFHHYYRESDQMSFIYLVKCPVCVVARVLAACHSRIQEIASFHTAIDWQPTLILNEFLDEYIYYMVIIFI